MSDIYVKYCPSCCKRVVQTFFCEYCGADLEPSQKDITDSVDQDFINYLEKKKGY